MLQGVDDITKFYDKSYPVEIYPQPYRDIWISCFEHAKDTGEVIAKDIIAVANDGREIWFDSTFIPVKEDDGKIKYIIVTSEDITQRKDAQKQLEELNKNLEQRIKEEVEKSLKKDKQLLKQSRLAQMGEILSMIAHQWRQPLTAISSTALTIELKLMLNKIETKELTESMQKIASFSQHLSVTIDDFRDFFKTNKEKSITSFKEIVESTCQIVGTSIESRNIIINRGCKGNVEFKSYPNELKQVLLNILKNAEDVLVEKKVSNAKINIQCYKKEDEIILEIEDNAGGIDSNIIDDIFDPYFTTKDKRTGTGLGLYMSKNTKLFSFDCLKTPQITFFEKIS